MSQQYTMIEDILETMEKVLGRETLSGMFLSVVHILRSVIPQVMNPHPSHKLKTINVVKNFQILYCDYCSLFATHPEIEKPCKQKPDLLAEVLRREALQREYAMYKSGRWTPTRPFEEVDNS